MITLIRVINLKINMNIILLKDYHPIMLKKEAKKKNVVDKKK